MLIKYSISNDTPLDTLGVTRQGIQKLTIENVKLTMNRLENIARYTNGNYQLATGPQWELYYGWNSYQYCKYKINYEKDCQ